MGKDIVYGLGVEEMVEGMQQALMDPMRADLGVGLEDVIGNAKCFVAAVGAMESGLGQALKDWRLIPFYGIAGGDNAKEEFRKNLEEHGYTAQGIKEIPVSEIPIDLAGVLGLTRNLRDFKDGSSYKSAPHLITWPAQDKEIYKILSMQRGLHKPTYSAEGITWESPEKRIHPVTAYFRVKKLVNENSNLQVASVNLDMRGTDQEAKYGKNAEYMKAYAILKMPTQEEIKKLDAPEYLIREAMLENLGKQAVQQYGGTVRRFGMLPIGQMLPSDKLPYDSGYEGILKQLEAQIEKNELKGVHIGIF